MRMRLYLSQFSELNRVRYGYGIDLAETLNYCGITVLRIQNNIQIQTLRKFNKKSYPEIRALLLNDLFPRFPPDYVATDYTSEKSFSEELEASLNPLFTLAHVPEHGKWKYVLPIRFSLDSKLAMKQNSRYMIESKIFVPPPEQGSPPEIFALWEELYAQLFREVADHSSRGTYMFPKPQGFDNDLAMSFELAMFGAKDMIQEVTGDVNRESIVMSYTEDEIYPDKVKNILQNPRIAGKMKKFGEEIGVEVNGKIVDRKKVQWW